MTPKTKWQAWALEDEIKVDVRMPWCWNRNPVLKRHLIPEPANFDETVTPLRAKN